MSSRGLRGSRFLNSQTATRGRKRWTFSSGFFVLVSLCWRQTVKTLVWAGEEFKSWLKFTPPMWCLDKSEAVESSALQLPILRREKSLLRWICNTLWRFDSTRQQMNSQQQDCLISGGFLWSGHCVAAAEDHLPIWGRTCVSITVHLCVWLLCWCVLCSRVPPHSHLLKAKK